MGMITAHSGCDKTQDNSIEFIRYALASDADCLEVDVRRNQKGELFLSHDETGEEDVKLSDAFTLLKEKPEKKMNYDLKLKDLELHVYRLAKEFQVEKQIIYSGTVTPELLKEKENLFPEVKIYLDMENLIPEIYDNTGDVPGRIREALKQVMEYQVSCINMEYHFFTDKVMEELAELGLEISAWTVDCEEELRRLMEKGIENITTRNLKRALEIREELTK